LRAALGLALAASCAALAGCGAGVTAGDLFLVERSGSTPHAHVTMVVDEQGGVTCNGSRKLHVSDAQLVKARAIQEELQSATSHHLTLPPRARSVYRYFLRDEGGWVRFSDNSAGATRVMHELQLYVLTVAQQVCHLPE